MSKSDQTVRFCNINHIKKVCMGCIQASTLPLLYLKMILSSWWKCICILSVKRGMEVQYSLYLVRFLSDFVVHFQWTMTHKRQKSFCPKYVCDSFRISSCHQLLTGWGLKEWHLGCAWISYLSPIPNQWEGALMLVNLQAPLWD